MIWSFYKSLFFLDSKWKELSQVAADRQKKLEESSNYLTQFQAAEAQLKQWLVEKELMVSVLGPLSIDPNMLNTQKQQVQVSMKSHCALFCEMVLVLLDWCGTVSRSLPHQFISKSQLI